MRLRLLGAATVIFIAAITDKNASAGAEKPSTPVSDALDMLVEHASEPIGQNPGIAQLATLPSVEVVRSIVAALSNDQRFSEPATREAAYVVLGIKHAGDLPEGRQQIIRGTSERSVPVAAVCLRELGRLGIQGGPDAIAAIESLWKTIDLSAIPARVSGTDKLGEFDLLQALLEATAALGNSGRALLPYTESALTTPALDERLRAAAAFAIVRIEGIGNALRQFDKSTHVSEAAVLFGVARYCAEARTTGNLSADDEKKVQDRFLRDLDHTEPAIREMALRNLSAVLGQGGVKASPSFREKVTELSQKDADPRLREIARGVLNPD